MARFRLKYPGGELILPRGTLVVGRGQECDLSFDDDDVSRRHAELHVEAERVRVEDLGSLNGVEVNGRPVDGSRALRHGDRILIGNQELVLWKTLDQPARNRPTRRRAQAVPPASAADDDLGALSPRELQVLKLVAQGHTQREVAEMLELSVKTVESYRAHIAEKLGLKKRADLVRFALEKQLLDGS